MQVTHENYATRQGKSCCAMCCGFILVPITIMLIFWNENNAVVNYETAKVVWGATEVEDCLPREQDGGNLVLAACDVSAPDLAPGLPSPLRPFLGEFQGSELTWKTEIYLYKETSTEECHKDDKGGKTCIKHYSCDLAWSDSWIDSSDFQCDGHPSNARHTFPRNFQAMGKKEASEYTVILSHNGTNRSGLALDLQLQRQLPSVYMADNLKRFAKGQTVKYGRFGGDVSEYMLQVYGGYLTTFDSQPRIGDLRISLQGRSAATATAAAKQSKTKSTPGMNYKLGSWPPQKFGLFGKETKPLEKLIAGRLSPGEFVEAWNNEITANLWLIRFVALVLMVVAFEMIVQPLSVSADLLRMLNCCTCGLGSLLDGAAQCLIHTLAITAALCVYLVSVAIAWIAARPLFGILLLAAAVAIAYGIGRMQKRKARQVVFVESGTRLTEVAAMPVAVAQPAMQVTCPTGSRPGDVMTVRSPGGQCFTVEVPQGIQPGQAFNAQMPA